MHIKSIQDELKMNESKKHSDHEAFRYFKRVKCICSGQHMYDFLGVATDVTFKKGWHIHAMPKGKSITPKFPAVNEHYFDWIALLTAVLEARGVFRMAELGAGYGPWLLRGAFASRQCKKIEKIELLGLEADPTHFHWMEKHFQDNGISPFDHTILHGAIALENNKLLFPKIPNPEENYGASLLQVSSSSTNLEVQGYTLDQILNHFDYPIDLLHMDAQGVEYDVIPVFESVLSKKVRYLVIGTHVSQQKHEELFNFLLSKDWQPKMSFPKSQEVMTEFGSVKFDDGFQFWKNSKL